MKHILGVIACALVACRGGSRQPVDPHSFAEPDRVAVRALTLDLTVDFAQKVLSGTAKLELTRKDRSAQLVLDDEGLAISGVTDCEGKKLGWHVGTRINIGAPLRIDLGSGDCVEIAYRTSPDASAMLWVEPSGTAGGVKPMLFTQSQAIRARTWIPLQDSPSVRFTYKASIHAPAGMRALMSGENAKTADGDTWRVVQNQPIPSYLMALAVGDFVFREIGPRSGVYAEPAIADAAAREFGEVEQMMAAAEKLYGPYRWGRYDMLVLPPSFPFGGMENPNLTFLTPTVITGDRALVGLIAHELAHSWSGNLVTNKTWNDVWLNEGFTTYVEIRIMEELRGKEYADLLWFMSVRDIRRQLDELGSASIAQTSLSHTYGRDIAPDEFPADMAYDKGALFLRTLELAYGREKFDAFLRGWFDQHAFQPADTKLFIADATRVLGNKVDLRAWLYEGGIPASAAPAPSTVATRIVDAATAFASAGTLPDASAWTTMEWVVFIKALPKDITAERLDALDAAFHLTNTTNAEISMHWLPRLVNADDRAGGPAAEKFLATVGRRRMVMPVYEAMHVKNDWWRALAKQTFERAKAMYHPITRESVAQLLAGAPVVR